MTLFQKSNNWEKNIYGKGAQINHWPYTEVVSVIIRATEGIDRTELKLLEVGCGTGNNLWFALEAGFSVAGIDISPTAVKYARARLSKLGFLNHDLLVGDTTSLPWPEASFDMVLDRGALTHTSYSKLRKSLAEIHRVLKPDGKFFSFDLFGKSCTDKMLGKEVSKNTYYFPDVGLTSFFDHQTIARFFKNFHEVIIVHRQDTHLKDGHIVESYSVSCSK